MQSIATGLRRDPILVSIAEGYAAADLDAALAWVYSVQPISVEAVNAVIRIMAVEDPLRAYAIVRQTGDQPSIYRIEQTLAAAVLESGLDPALIATPLVQRFEPEFSDPFVAALLNSWVLQAPDRAMEWLAENRSTVTPEAVSTMVSTLAFEDVRLAASLLEMVPPEFECQWLRQRARRYGQFDPDAAVEWVTQFGTRSDYEQLLGEMVQFGDFRFVSTLIESTEHAFDSSSIFWASNMFAAQDPRSSAEWALRLTDADEAAAAVGGVTNGWLRTDPAGAQRWALETQRGEPRDEIIDTLFEQGRANDRTDD